MFFYNFNFLFLLFKSNFSEISLTGALNSVIFFIGLSIYNFKHLSIRMLTIEDTFHSFIRKYVSFLNAYFKRYFNWTYHPKKVLIELRVEDDEIIENDDNTNTKKIKNEIEKKWNKKPIDLKKLENYLKVIIMKMIKWLKKNYLVIKVEMMMMNMKNKIYLQNQNQWLFKFNDGKTTELS